MAAAHALLTTLVVLVPLVVLGCAAVMIAVELRAPGRRWPKVAGFWARAALLNGAQAGIVLVSGMLWDDWMRAHRPWSLDALGPTLGAIVGYVVITFVYYFWHRARHEVPFLWRWVHQVHHSPQRIEILTSFYKHPIEMVLNGILSSAILYILVGLDAKAATYAVLLTGIAELFYHWNVKTPRWLGRFVQRPEMHCVHHERGVHSSNYGDLPLWDVLFGTYSNPAVFVDRCGFEPANEKRLGEMLRGAVVEGEEVIP